jgi:uridine kinase
MVENIVKRDGRIVPFDNEKIVFAILQAAVAVGGRDRKTAEAVTADVVKLLAKRDYSGSFPTVEEVQDLVEKCLIERGHARTAKAYIVYRYEHALKRVGRQSLTYSSDNVPYRKLWQALSWAVDNECVNTAQLRDLAEQGGIQTLVAKSEAFYTEEIENAFSKLKNRLQAIRLIIVAGPSASGKTTTTIKLEQKLKTMGYSLVALNIDNYFFDLDLHPQDSYGDYDFETPQAIDLKLVNTHLKDLIRGKTIRVPRYDFKKGKRVGIAEEINLPEKGIILIDSLHGMFPEMTAGIPEEQKFRLYIETLSQVKDNDKNYIRWSDVRMCRRMVRDMQYRNYDPLTTIRHWHHVRRAELRYIVSKISGVDVIVNSYLAYELPVMKERLAGYLPRYLEGLKDDINTEDAFERVSRISELFSQIPVCEDQDIIPADSLLREFIGGSVYTY